MCSNACIPSQRRTKSRGVGRKLKVGLPVGWARGWTVWNDHHNPMVYGTNNWIYIMLTGESLYLVSEPWFVARFLDSRYFSSFFFSFSIKFIGMSLTIHYKSRTMVIRFDDCSSLLLLCFLMVYVLRCVFIDYVVRFRFCQETIHEA